MPRGGNALSASAQKQGCLAGAGPGPPKPAHGWSSGRDDLLARPTFELLHCPGCYWFCAGAERAAAALNSEEQGRGPHRRVETWPPSGSNGSQSSPVRSRQLVSRSSVPCQPQAYALPAFLASMVDYDEIENWNVSSIEAGTLTNAQLFFLHTPGSVSRQV